MTLFAGGVHASGKSSTLKTACDAIGAQYVMASRLIADRLGFENWTKSKKVISSQENQLILIDALKNIEQSHSEVVLDGHFVLRRDVGVHEIVETDIFARLGVRAAFLFQAPSNIIAERLIIRGDTTWSLSEIESFSRLELSHAEITCANLKIPLVKFLMPPHQEVLDSLRKFITAAPRISKI